MALATFWVEHEFSKTEAERPVRHVTRRVSLPKPVTIAVENMTVDLLHEEKVNGSHVLFELPSSENTEIAGKSYTVEFLVDGRAYPLVTIPAQPSRFNADGTVNPYPLTQFLPGGQFDWNAVPAPSGGDWSTSAIFPSTNFTATYGG